MELQSQNCTCHMSESSDIAMRSTGRSSANRDVNVDSCRPTVHTCTCTCTMYTYQCGSS